MTVKAVDEASLRVEQEEFVGLVGPTSMSDGQRTRFRRQYIGFVFQASNLIRFLNCQENVELMLKLNGTLSRETRQEAIRLLDRLALADRLRSLPSQLSGGQQQGVAIARALIHKPAVVLADEPTASLDSKRAHQVVQTSANLIHEQERAGVMVTHDLRMCRYVDKVIQMMDGRMTRVGTKKEDIVALADLGEQEEPPPTPAAETVVA